MLENFGMETCKPTPTPLTTSTVTKNENGLFDGGNVNRYREAIGALLYISTRTRPDIAASVGILARKFQAPTNADSACVKRIMRYLQGTKDLGLNVFWKNDAQRPIIEAYADADWAGDTSDRKSTSGVLIMVNGNPVAWKSKKQVGVALSSTEAEYISVSECVKVIKWARMSLSELNMLETTPTVLFEDNMGAIRWSSGEKRAKHVDIRFHFVRDEAENGTVELKYCPTAEMAADILTKPVSARQLEHLRSLLRIGSVEVPGN